MIANKVSLLLLSVTLLFVTGCNNQAQKNEITIAAASDVYLAFTEIGELFKEETGINVTFSFGSTGQLSKQIEEGAPFDLFAAANDSFIRDLSEKKSIISDYQKIYAIGRLGVYYPHLETMDFNVNQQLLDTTIKTIAIANPEHAPYGKAAKEALESMGIWDQVKEKVVYAENIRQAYQFVETGNADVGIIARALIEEQAVDKFLLLDSQTHQPITQTFGIPAQSKNKAFSKQFVDFVMSDTGQEILIKYGFEIPQE